MPLRIVDVAIFYSERSGGIRTYLDAKVAYARATGAYDHHVIVPGTREQHADHFHELPSIAVSRASGYRLPLGSRRLHDLIAHLRPDVVMLHDPYWRPVATAALGRRLGAATILVHHCSSSHAAAASPFPRLAKPLLDAWFRTAYRRVDAVMAGDGLVEDDAVRARLELRLGLDPAFRPQPAAERGEHVLYVGRFSPEKSPLALLEVAARSADPWPLVLVGAGPLERRLRRRTKRLRISDRVCIHRFVRERATLARLYAGAACVVVPGAYDTFGLVALEAAASGARVVACATSPAGAQIGSLVHAFPAGDVAELAACIEAARAVDRDLVAAASLADRHTWERALSAELADIAEFLRGRRKQVTELGSGGGQPKLVLG